MKKLACLLTLTLAGCASPTLPVAAFSDLTAEQANRALQQTAMTVVDVRTPAEFAGGHLQGAINIPVAEIQTRAPQELSKDQPIFVYCGTGRRSRVAVDTLERLGYARLFNLRRGLSAWPYALEGATVAAQ